MATQKKEMNASDEDNSKLVQMRMQPKILESINNLTKLTGTTSRTQLIASSIQLTEAIVNSMQDGGKVYIETKDGQKQLLKIVGI